MTSTEFFKRGQVEDALWQRFAMRTRIKPKISKKFQTRIKRLLDLDRQETALNSSTRSSARYAFLDTTPEGRGTDVSFTPFNVFCLALGLDLLDVGLKQSEIRP